MGALRLFLCGDVMLGRGIDQILAHPCDPALHEGFVSSAVAYVELAEGCSGPVPRGVDPVYVWGDALSELERAAPDLRIVNLETSITTSPDFVPKGINYRMNPENISSLSCAGIDCCVLANNHVLDWNTAGLLETLATLKHAGIAAAGAGEDSESAAAPAILHTPTGARVLVFAFGSESSGIPRDWSAGQNKPGVNLLRDLSEDAVARIAAQVKAVRRSGDIVVASIHWGGNWGYFIPATHRRFAHDLVDIAGCDLVHGHSSHHAKAMEIYRDRLILYGCGDFITDYEGIGAYEAFRGDLAVMYLPNLDAATACLLDLRMLVFQSHRFRLAHAVSDDVAWLARMLDGQSAEFGTHIVRNPDNTLSAVW
jgi:poly-gamma-glutamate synthesis protein (capsule biosynthesis protein)